MTEKRTHSIQGLFDSLQPPDGPSNLFFFSAKEDVWSESPFQQLFHYRTVKKRVHSGGSADFDRPAVSDMPTITCDVQKPSLHDAIEHHFTDDKTEVLYPLLLFLNLFFSLPDLHGHAARGLLRQFEPFLLQQHQRDIQNPYRTPNPEKYLHGSLHA